VFGCMRRAIVLVLILVLLGGAYLFRGKLKDTWDGIRGRDAVAEAPSEELASASYNRIEELREGKVDRVALGTTELQSLLQYKYMGALPAFASQPNVELKGDRMRLKVRVPVDRIPDVRGLGDVSSFLPDTADVEVAGTLIPLPSGRIALGVETVQAAGIPLPQRMVNSALSRVGRRDEAGLPRDAIAVNLPPGVRAAYIRGDSLILLSRTGN
jgi:hypothetical protein